MFYQYNFHSASNIYAGMIQTESPYFQPTPQPPAPFAKVVGKFPGDPDYTCAKGDEFSGCDESWATIITGSENIFISAAGLYSVSNLHLTLTSLHRPFVFSSGYSLAFSDLVTNCSSQLQWFSTYSQDCIDTQQCQKALLYLKNNFANVRITNLITIGSKYMAVMDGKGIQAKDNLNVNVHPMWSQISVLDVGRNGTTNFDEYIWVDPKIWQMDQPRFTCSTPCNVKIPPWKGATSTVNYPLITVSQGNWKTTITHPPLTISEWVFEPETLTLGSNKNVKRADHTFWPTPATTPFWPAVVYTGSDGKPTTTSASGAFPKPPKSLSPGAVKPPSGRWPDNPLEVVFHIPEGPYVNECGFLDFEDPSCLDKPWFWIDPTEPEDPGDIENIEDSKTRCPHTSKSTSTITRASSTHIEEPEPEPTYYRQGDPRTNSVSCYDSGLKADGSIMHNAATSFCNVISEKELGPEFYYSQDFSFSTGAFGNNPKITVSLEIAKDCSFGKLRALSGRALEARDGDGFSQRLCEKYISVATDSCNCSGVNKKQGGVVENDCYKWRIDPNYVF